VSARTTKRGPAAPLALRPGGGLHFNVDDETWQRTAQAQRSIINEAAADIEAGRVPAHQKLIAAVLRQAALSIPLEQPKRRGARPQFNHGSAAMTYAILRRAGKTDKEAIDILEIDLGVSRQAIAKALPQEVKAEAMRQFDDSVVFIKKRPVT